MNDLVKLIDQYRPGFSAEIQPAAEEQIEEMQELAGPLPGAYVRFLRTMGSKMADFKPLDASLDIEDRILNYQLNDALRGSDLLLIAASGSSGPGGEVFLDRNEKFGKDDCLVVVIPLNNGLVLAKRKAIHVGLEELLFVEAYRQFRLPLLPETARLMLSPTAPQDAGIVEQVFAVAAQQAFQRVPPIVHSALFERGDAAIVFYRNPRSAVFTIQISTDQPEKLHHIADTFSTYIPLTRLE